MVTMAKQPTETERRKRLAGRSKAIRPPRDRRMLPAGYRTK